MTSGSHHGAPGPCPETTPMASSPGGLPIPSLHTPHKHMGQFFNQDQYRTPNSRPRLPCQSPFIRTVSSGKSSSSSSGRRVAPNVCPVSGISPQLCSPAGGGVYNPFDVGVLENLGQPVFSPNVFASKGTLGKSPPGFHWSIEHLAVLHPADIDELPVHQAHTAKLDHELEAHAQKAIDAYFASHHIVPSPWTDSAKKKPFRLPMTPSTPASGYNCYSPAVHATPKSQEDSAKTENGKQDACAQTVLTLPIDFDLQKVLGEYYTQKTGEEAPTDLSASSLRRKLFFHGEADVPPSPVPCSRGVATAGLEMDFDISPRVSPVKCQTPHHIRHTPHETPGSNQFSSSPIRGSFMVTPVTPGLRRCSTAPDLMASPELSPIALSAHRPQRPDPLSSEGSTPLCAPLEATPSSGLPSLRLGSPGMSPIRMEDGSFAAMQSTRSFNRSRGMVAIPTPGELQPDLFRGEDDGDSELRMTDLQTSMDTDNCHNTRPVPLYDTHATEHNPKLFGRTSIDFAINEDTMDGNMDSLATHDLISHACVLTSQDAGYHSNSLQLTNQDTGLHTNLTSQFGSLPLSNQDTGIEDYSEDADQSAASKHGISLPSRFGVSRPVPEPCASSAPCKYEFTSALEESSVVLRAREVLARLNGETPYQEPVVSGKTCNIGHKSGSAISPWQRPTLSTPHRLRYQELGVITDEKAAKELKASDLATEILSRAGRDYEKFCKPSFKHDSTNRVAPSLADKKHLAHGVIP